MATKDVRKLTLAKNRANGTYAIVDMDGMVEINIDSRIFRVDDQITQVDAKWLEDNWVTDETEDGHTTKRTLKVKRGN